MTTISTVEIQALLEEIKTHLEILHEIISNMTDEELADNLWLWEAISETAEIQAKLTQDLTRRHRLRLVVDNTKEDDNAKV